MRSDALRTEVRHGAKEGCRGSMRAIQLLIKHEQRVRCGSLRLNSATAAHLEQAKVGNLDIAIVVEQHVVRLQTASTLEPEVTDN